nr:hypothetical protein [Candidatus Synechococcus spongiarum]
MGAAGVWLRQAMVCDLMVDQLSGNVKLLAQVMDVHPLISEARAQGFSRRQKFCCEGPGSRLARRIHGGQNAQASV